MNEIKFDKRNYRKHNDKNKKLIKKSLQECGAGRSIIIDNEGEIIAGNGVYEQAQKLGLKTKIVETDGSELVVVKRTDLATDDDKRKRLAVMDNSTSDTSEFDIDLLEEDFAIEDLNDMGLDLKIEDEEEEKEIVEDEVPDQMESRCKEGDVWELGEHRLICGDSTDAEVFAKLMQGEKADFVFTDPPYGVAIGDKNKTLTELGMGGGVQQNIKNDNIKLEDLQLIILNALTNLRLNCKDDAVYYVTAPAGGDIGLMMQNTMKDAGLLAKHILFWEKNSATFSIGRLDYEYQHEPIFYTWTKKHHNYRKGKFRTTIWKIDRPQKSELHPTMKPVELVANALLDGTLEGDIALDCFGGSGTTLIACEQLKRKARLIELDPHYCDVIIQRWENLTGKKAELITDAD